MKQMIIAVDADANLKQMPELLRGAISSAGIQWPEPQMPGTIDVDGKKLVLVMSRVDGEVVSTLIKSFNLDWKVMAEEGVAIDQSPLLPFFAPMPKWDIELENVEFVPVTDLTDKLQTWSGHTWLY